MCNTLPPKTADGRMLPGIDESETQHEINDAKGLGIQGYDPRKERKVKQHDPKPERPPVTAKSLLETWYHHRTSGRLKSVGANLQACDGTEGADEALLASLYIESTLGYSQDVLKPILLHRMDGKPWATWYGRQSRALAAAMFDGFVFEIERRLQTEPFVVYATNVRTPDHLEQADAANEVDLEERNRTWRKKVA